jgi:hypothetical protein
MIRAVLWRERRRDCRSAGSARMAEAAGEGLASSMRAQERSDARGLSGAHRERRLARRPGSWFAPVAGVAAGEGPSRNEGITRKRVRFGGMQRPGGAR